MRLLEFFRPFRIVAARRISEEETITVEAFCRDSIETTDRLEDILLTFRNHRKRSNEEVVRATQQQLTALDTAIKARTDQLSDLDGQLERARAECRKFDEILAGKKRRGAVLDIRPNGPTSER